MTARKLVLTATALLSALALQAPAAMAAGQPTAQAAGLLGETTDLLTQTTNTLLDEAGNLLGELDSTTGELTDLTGEVIGTLDSTTGTITDSTGEIIAILDPETGELSDPQGNTYGTVVPTATGEGGGPGRAALTMALDASRTQRLSAVARRGVSARTTCSAACGILAAVSLDGRTAKRLGLGRGTQPVVVGTAIAGAGTLPIRISSRARRALSRALPSSRTRKSIRAKRARAFRKYRSRSASRSVRGKARRSYLRYRRIERRWISTGRVKFIVAAVGMDAARRTTTIRRQSLVVKR